MKRIFSIMLVIVMAAALPVTAFARSLESSSYNDVGDKTADVEYGVGETFVVTIPETIAFDGSEGYVAAGIETTETVSATNVVINSGKTLKVTVSSGNNWNMVDDDTDVTLDYKVSVTDYNTGNLGQGGLVLSVSAGTTSGEATLYAYTTGTNQAGNYQDRLTFFVTLE